MKEGVFPSCLKRALVVAIHKSGSHDDDSNYRPISLLSILSKVFERVLKNRMALYFEQHGLFVDNQFGFRAGRSTSDAIMSFVDHCLRAFQDGAFSVASFYDLSKAFDCVPHALLLEKLRKYGMSERAVGLIGSYLREREQCVLFNDERSEFRAVEIGVPEGSILGPLLFLVHVYDLPMFMPFPHVVQFTDDTSSIVSNAELAVAVQGNEETSSAILNWMNDNGLCLNVDKRVTMILSKRPHCLPCAEQTKFLGVVIDSGLTWRSHCEGLGSKLRSSVFLCRDRR